MCIPNCQGTQTAFPAMSGGDGGANLQEACAKGKALKELVEGEGRQEGTNDAYVAGHAKGHSDQHLLPR